MEQLRTSRLERSRDITRGEMAILIDKVLDPFHKKPVDITGQLN